MPVNFDDLLPQKKAIDFNDLLPETQPARPNGLFARMEQAQQPAMDRYNSGVQSGPETMVQATLAGGKQMLNDLSEPVLNAIAPINNSLLNATPAGYLFNKVKPDVISAISNSAAGDLGRNTASKIKATYSEFQQDHPRAAGNIQAGMDLGEIGLSFAPIKGKSLAGRTVGPVGEVAGDAILAAGKKLNTKTIVPSSDEIRQMAGPIFQRAEAMGGNIAPDVADAYRNKVLSTLNLEGEAGGYLSNPAAERILKTTQEYAGKPMSFTAAKSIREALGDLAWETMDDKGHISAAGKKFLDLQGDLDRAMETLPNNAELKQARALWAASIRMSDVEKILARAKDRDQPVTIIKNGFNALLQRGDRLKGYSPAEVKAIERAAKTGIVGGALRGIGSGLFPYLSAGVGAAGGGLGAAAGWAAGQGAKYVSKAASTALQENRANNVAKAIADSAGLTQTTNRINLPAYIKKIMLMPPAEAKKALEDLPTGQKAEAMKLLPAPNSASAMTDSQIKAAQVAINKPYVPTGPDFEMNVTSPSIWVKPEIGQTTRLLPAPGKYSGVPLSDKEISIAQAKMSRGNPNKSDLSGLAIKTPVDQMVNVSGKVGTKRRNELTALTQMLNAGDLSQNQFVKEAARKFGLTERQARQLAKDSQRNQ